MRYGHVVRGKTESEKGKAEKSIVKATQEGVDSEPR